MTEPSHPKGCTHLTHATGKSLKVAVLREEFVALTNDPLVAVVLNQLLYWTLRVKDFDLLIEEEKQFNPDCSLPPRHGWIYKSAQDLIEETMLHVSCSTMRRYIKTLINHGWIDQRSNPHHKFNKTTQYRLNLGKLQNDLITLGFNLPGFSLHLQSKEENLKSAETSNFQNEKSIPQIDCSNNHLDGSKCKNCSPIYLIETTTKTKNKDHTLRGVTPGVCKKNDAHQLKKDDVPSSMIDLWQKYIGQDEISLSQSRRSKLQSLLKLHFENDLSKWKAFCKRIKDSPFLMGQGPNKWHVTFHWILLKGNILKVLEGNFDSPETLNHKKEVNAQEIRKQKNKEIINSIKDTQWREWCDQLSEFPNNGFSPVNKPYLWWQLERVTNAKFIDFDGRLVTLGSTDPKVINELENNRFQIGSVVSRTFPTSRGIRTELLPTQKSNSSQAIGDKIHD